MTPGPCITGDRRKQSNGRRQTNIPRTGDIAGSATTAHTLNALVGHTECGGNRFAQRVVSLTYVREDSDQPVYKQPGNPQV